MKIKTFKSKNMEDFDKQVNNFEANHNVKFTQTHIGIIQGNPAGVLYSAVVFYEE